MKRLGAFASVVVLSAALTACGSDDGGGSTNERPSAADRATLLACLEEAGIRVVPSGKVDVTVEGRVPRVPVSADYVGAALLPSGGFYDVWLASDGENATAAAEELNAALSERLGAETVGAAARGVIVSAVGGNVQVNNISEYRAIYACNDRF
jgi:hypothetical protein